MRLKRFENGQSLPHQRLQVLLKTVVVLSADPAMGLLRMCILDLDRLELTETHRQSCRRRIDYYVKGRGRGGVMWCLKICSIIFFSLKNRLLQDDFINAAMFYRAATG